VQQGQVVDEAQVAVGREVVLALQRDRLARRPHEVHGAVLGDEVGAGPVHVEAGVVRLHVEHDEFNVVPGLRRGVSGQFGIHFAMNHWEP
jgi:hypothetical protein